MYTYTMYSIFSAYRAHAMHIRSAVMLSWLVDKKVVGAALNDSLIEEHIECRPEKVSDAVVDVNVDVKLIRKYFSYDGWLLCDQPEG